MILFRGAAFGAAAGLAIGVAGLLVTFVLAATDDDSSTQYPWIFVFFVIATPALVVIGAGVLAAATLVADHARVTRPVDSARRRGAAAAAGLAALLSLLTVGTVGLVGAAVGAIAAAALGYGIALLVLRRVLRGPAADAPEQVGSGLPRPRWQRPLLIGLVALVAFWAGAAIGGNAIEALGLGRDLASAGALVVALVSAAAGGAVAHRTLA